MNLGAGGEEGTILFVCYPILRLPLQSHLSLEDYLLGGGCFLTGAEVASRGAQFNWILSVCRE